MLRKLGVGVEKLGKRIESHLVPFKELRSERGTMRQRYMRYLQKRAELMVERIEELATVP